jgi:hypothetical protein
MFKDATGAIIMTKHTMVIKSLIMLVLQKKGTYNSKILIPFKIVKGHPLRLLLKETNQLMTFIQLPHKKSVNPLRHYSIGL